MYAGTSRQVRYTAALIEYSDPTNLYQLSTEYVEDLAGIQRYGYRPKTETAIGVTSRGQAHRHGLRLLTTSRMEIDSVTFSVGLTGISQVPGDVIRIADPLRYNQNRMGGRISTGSTASAIVLDAPVALIAGKTYRLAVIGSDGSVWDSAVTNAAGSTATINISPAFSSAPAHELEFIVYDANADTQTYRILRITDNPDRNNGFFTVIATAYDINKFAVIDAVAALPPLPDNPYIQTAVNAPSNLVVTVGTVTELQGISRYMDISWSPAPGSLIAGYYLSYSLNGAIIFESQITGTSYRIKNPVAGDYLFSVAAMAFGGLFSPSVVVTHTLGILYLIGSVSVTGLALKTGGTTFAGRQAEIVWSTDAATVLGSTYASGAGGQSPWFRDYQIDVYSGSTLLRSEYDTSGDYIYTYDKNIQDGGPRRTVSFTIRARDNYGNYSNSASITVNNPSPAAIAPSNLSIYGGYKSLIVNYVPPSDNDYAGVIIYLGTATGFTPGSGNQAYIGSTEPVVLTNLTEGTTYYLRIATYDDFGGASDYTLSTTEYNHAVTALAAQMLPADIQTGLQTALDTDANALVFDASNFGVRLAGSTKIPFIVGNYQGSPAILMDATVVVTGPLSASQLKSGTLDAAQTITIGNGDTVLNGDGSIICYNGDSSISNRDFAMLNAGEITFQKYRSGAYHTYKSLRRVEYGTANSGSTVTLPGFWDSQPIVQVSPYALQTFNAAQSSQSLTWQIRADNLRETVSGSGVWQFDAVAQLTYSSASGNKTVSSTISGGAAGSYSWTSAADTVPTGTVSVTPTVTFSSIRGNGSSTYGYYYRSVNWKIQAFVGTGWSDVSGASKTRNILQSEHGNTITDSMAANLPAGTTQIRIVFTASDTNGTTYSQGANTYNKSSIYVPSNTAGTHAELKWNNIAGGGPGPLTINTPSAALTSGSPSIPSGWSVYAVNYGVSYIFGTMGVDNPLGYSNGNYIYATSNGQSATINTGVLNTSTFNPNFWVANVSGTEYSSGGYYLGGQISLSINNPTATVYIQQLNANSTTSADNFTFVNYAWNISGSTAVATGSLNYIAVGD
jgi:hypothetical protein